MLLGYARRMLTLEDELEREMGEVGTRIAGRLEIGASTGPGELLLPRLCGAFVRAHPDVRVSLVVQDSQSVCDRVLEHDLELGVVGAARPHRGLVFETFARDELVVIVPPEHRLAGRGSITLAELAAEPMIMQQEGSGVRSVLEAAMRAQGLRAARPQRDHGARPAAIRQGRGPRPAGPDGHLAPGRGARGGRGRPGGARGRRRGPRARLLLGAPRGRTPSRLTTAFLEFARAELGTGVTAVT